MMYLLVTNYENLVFHLLTKTSYLTIGGHGFGGEFWMK